MDSDDDNVEEVVEGNIIIILIHETLRGRNELNAVCLRSWRVSNFFTCICLFFLLCYLFIYILLLF